MAQFDVATWLKEHRSNGVAVDMAELLYYRNRTSLLNLNPHKTVQARLAGTYLTKMKGRGMEFDEARHYQPGDDIRAIDWRVTARTGKTHTKLFREEKERPVFILVDLSHSMHFGTQLLFKSVMASHLGALIAWSAAKRGDRIGGLIFNEKQHREFKPMTRQKAVLSLLSGIKNLHENVMSETPEQVFDDACARIRRLARPGSAVFILSDFLHLSATAQRHLSQLSRHCEVIGYRISDPFEHQLPKVSLPQTVAITDGKKRQTITLGEHHQAMDYQQIHARFMAENRKMLEQAQVQVMDVNCGLPLEMQLNPLQKIA
ncbi:DUF58 domain-containing protein [Planctobacterium marinum]|uniref:DUF58 domain-containing protein n=1 Tax=Planctobacterium marinum TaxID=1631968 RepID=A0AA48KRK5_9ALTE|nr:hypothetical protein MACH26_17330 [Planctobacterium marinum]